MRYGLLLLALVLMACNSARRKHPVPPPPIPGHIIAAKPANVPVKKLQVLPLSPKGSRIAEPEVVAALDAALRAELAKTKRYELVDENPDLVLTTVLHVCRIQEVGAGTAFTMRDLGLDAGPEFAVADVELQATLNLDGKDVKETVTRRLKAGEGISGLTREDRDGDGRLEMHITPEGIAALLAPALNELTARIVERTDAAFAPPEPEPKPASTPKPKAGK